MADSGTYRRRRRAVRDSFLEIRQKICDGISDSSWSAEEVSSAMSPAQHEYDEYEYLSNRLHGELAAEAEVERASKLTNEMEAMAAYYRSLDGLATQYTLQLDAIRDSQCEEQPESDDEDEFLTLDQAVGDIDKLIHEMQQNLSAAEARKMELLSKQNFLPRSKDSSVTQTPTSTRDPGWEETGGGGPSRRVTFSPSSVSTPQRTSGGGARDGRRSSMTEFAKPAHPGRPVDLRGAYEARPTYDERSQPYSPMTDTDVILA